MAQYSYNNQLKNLTFDCASPERIYSSTNKYFLVIQSQCSDTKEIAKGLTIEAVLPAINLDGLNQSSPPLMIPYQGISIYAPGSTSQFEPLRFTLVDRDDLLYRKYLHQWQATIHNYLENVTSMVSTNLRKVTLLVMDHNNKFLRAYILHHAFPSVLDAIQLDWRNANQLGVYNVTMEYAYYEHTTSDSIQILPELNALEGYVNPQILSVIPRSFYVAPE